MAADDLARRLVESPRWKRTAPPHWYSGRESRNYDGFLWARAGYSGAWLPDLSDPATEGCLLRLAREAWAPRGGRVHVGPSSVAVFGHGRDPQWWDGPTGEALAHAILAAGEVRDA